MSRNTDQKEMLVRRVAIARGHLEQRLGALEGKGHELVAKVERAATGAAWLAIGVTAAGAVALVRAFTRRSSRDRTHAIRRPSILEYATLAFSVAGAFFAASRHLARPIHFRRELRLPSDTASVPHSGQVATLLPNDALASSPKR